MTAPDPKLPPSRDRIRAAAAAKVAEHLATRFDTVHEVWGTVTLGTLPPSAIYGYRVADVSRHEGPAIILAQVWDDGGFDLYVSSAESLLISDCLDGVVAAVRRMSLPPSGRELAPKGSFQTLEVKP